MPTAREIASLRRASRSPAKRPTRRSGLKPPDGDPEAKTAAAAAGCSGISRDSSTWKLKQQAAAALDSSRGSAVRPEGADEATPLLDVFIPGKVVNPTNQRWHWTGRMRWAKSWRNTTRLLVGDMRFSRSGWLSTDPKVVRFTLAVARRFDQDALGPCCKPLLDGLVDALLIHSDGPNSGHEFVYEQRVDRKHPGVRIVVEALR